jgi:hypothetical protein
MSNKIFFKNMKAKNSANIINKEKFVINSIVLKSNYKIKKIYNYWVPIYIKLFKQTDNLDFNLFVFSVLTKFNIISFSLKKFKTQNELFELILFYLYKKENMVLFDNKINLYLFNFWHKVATFQLDKNKKELYKNLIPLNFFLWLENNNYFYLNNTSLIQYNVKQINKAVMRYNRKFNIFLKFNFKGFTYNRLISRENLLANESFNYNINSLKIEKFFIHLYISSLIKFFLLNIYFKSINQLNIKQ